MTLVTESDNQLKEVTIGWLPQLKVLQLNGMKMKKVTGCGDVHRYCFREDRMELLQIPTLNMKRMGLPDFITEVKIDHNNASTGYGDADVFKNKRVITLRYEKQLSRWWKTNFYFFGNYAIEYFLWYIVVPICIHGMKNLVEKPNASATEIFDHF